MDNFLINGSSLLEILIALAIFSTVALGVGSQALLTLQQTKSALEQTREIIHHAQF